MARQTVWIIVHKEYGAYVDWKFTRSEMIEKHTRDVGKTWEQCKKDGDRAIKTTLTFRIPKD